MNDVRSIRLHYGVRAILLLTFALYIGYLVQQGTLHYYVAPKLARWVRLCPVPLVLMSVSLAVQVLFGSNSNICDCGHKLPRSGFRIAALYSLFLFPLLLGFLLPDRALDSIAAARKGIAFTFTSYEGRPGVTLESSSPNDQEYAELARILYKQPVINVYPELYAEIFGAIDRYKSNFAGKEIIVTGFLYPDVTGRSAENFAVSRFLVQCCTADATPLGIIVDPGTQISLPTDTWIEVRGKLQIARHNDQQIMQIAADSVIPVPQPSTPYIYTHSDSIAAWIELQELNAR
ncbi:TIGR03943 family putative permease subunit [Paenibacillus sp. sgz500958]|uniref:TIGR03943 family putative permease subunit n=1 Tax=Paenibacillus sp. sgz500958 TaxID=3242475 RepID=UPI0036D3849B